MSLRAESFTVGVEEEYQIIDPRTRELSSNAELLLPEAQEILGEAVQLELMLSQIEVATPVCHTLENVHAELLRLRQGITAAAARTGLQIAAAGTHPFSPWSTQQITPKTRYEHLVDDYQLLIRQQVIFGCHVHIGIVDREIAIPILNRARIWLPLLLAMAANSPFWEGEDTLYSSFRTGLWWTTPMSGPPPIFASRSEYDDLINTLIAAGCLENPSRIYWDIRLSHRFPTIEFRVMDVCMTVREATLLAGLVRALVRTGYEQARRGDPLSIVHPELLRASSWYAARYGLEANLVDVESARVVPARELLGRFLDLMGPALKAGGDWEWVSSALGTLMEQGNGATRQREIYTRTGNLEAVVDFIVAETAKEQA